MKNDHRTFVSGDSKIPMSNRIGFWNQRTQPLKSPWIAYDPGFQLERSYLSNILRCVCIMHHEKIWRNSSKFKFEKHRKLALRKTRILCNLNNIFVPEPGIPRNSTRTQFHRVPKCALPGNLLLARLECHSPWIVGKYDVEILLLTQRQTISDQDSGWKSARQDRCHRPVRIRNVAAWCDCAQF